MRSMFTLIVSVCDDEDLQKKLPQFLILSSAIARSSEIDHMRTMLPPNVFLWTRERAWTTTEVMVCVAKTLHACLRDDLEGRQVIFSSDVYRAHIATEVWRAMARLNFFYFLIPAKMTWAMQPCDTHVFALFKRHLAEAAQTVAVSAEDGHVPLTALVKVVCDIIVKVIRGRSWAKAFSDIGLVGHQTAVSQSVLGKLKLAAAPPVGDGLPTLAMLQEIWPAGAIIPTDAVFATVSKFVRQRRAGLKQHVQCVPQAGGPAASSGAAPVSSVPWPMVARSSSDPVPRARAPIARPLWAGLALRPRAPPTQSRRSSPQPSTLGRETGSSF